MFLHYTVGFQTQTHCIDAPYMHNDLSIMNTPNDTFYGVFLEMCLCFCASMKPNFDSLIIYVFQSHVYF